MRNPQKARSQSASVPAPVGGWNARDSLADMAVIDAVSMENYFPSTTTCVLRNGYSEYAEFADQQVETLMAYNGASTSELFAITNSGRLYDITTQGSNVDNYLNLPGADADYASTPDSAALDITGDLELIAYVQPNSWTPGTRQVIASKWLETGNQRSYMLTIENDGTLGMWISTAGTDASTFTIYSTGSMSGLFSSAVYIKASLDTYNADLGSDCNFYYSSDGSSYTQLGTEATRKANYLNLPGGATDYVTTPDSAALDITGDIQIVAYLDPDDWEVDIQLIARKWLTTGNQASWMWRLRNGAFISCQFMISTDGDPAGGVNYNFTTTIPDIHPLWLKVTLDVDNGVGGSTATLYYSTDGTSYTTLQAVTDVVVSIFSSTAVLSLGANTDGGGTFAGTLQRLQVYNGIGGTLVAEFNGQDGVVGASTVTSSATGEVYTLNSGTSIAITDSVYTYSSSTPTTIYSSTAPLWVGAYQTASASFDSLVGKLYALSIYSGISGTLAAYFSAADAAAGETTVVSSLTGETYTLNGAAAITNDSSIPVSGLTNGRFQHVNFTTSGGTSYLVMANGADSVYNYDGSTWTTPTITGVTSSTLNNVNIHKSRLWFTQNGTLKAWYLPTQAISGAANALDLSAYCPHGGTLLAMGTWTIDAGYGVDDMAVFVTTQGDCLVYRGTDPSSSVTWALVGVWYIGTPIGRRCFVKYQGDMLIICEDGLFQLSAALQSSRTNPKVALTDKIQQEMATAVSLYRSNFGWQVIPYDGMNMIVMNVPAQTGSQQQQFVMNTITGAWCKFTGWDANCFELYNNSLYFGSNGFVGKAWDTNADAGTAIAGTVQQSFNYYDSPGQVKRFTMMRPILRTNGQPSIQGAINVDFSTAPPASNLATITITGATWDSAVWDADVWQDTLVVSKNWQGATGIGYCGGVRLDSSTNGLQLEWVATDVVMERGAIL